MTWVVDAGGGPGVDFALLPDAVAAASDGDTILVHTGPFDEGANPFSTNKGLTIVGVGGAVPLWGNDAYEVVNLPAGSAFRMVGFSRILNGPYHVQAQNCQGAVHFESMRAREGDFFFPNVPSIVLDNCASVTLRDIVTFGTPAVEITDSTAILTQCRLGATELPGGGGGGGTAIVASNSTVSVIQPFFDTTFGEPASVVTENSTLRVGGDSDSYIDNDPEFGFPGGHAIVATGGSVTLDPDVVVSPDAGFLAIAGPTTITIERVPHSYTSAATPGDLFTVTTSVPPNSSLVQILGIPGAITPTPFGTLGVDITQSIASFPPTVVGASGSWSSSVVVSAGLPRGTAFTTQAVFVEPGAGFALGLGEPTTFVAH